MNDDLFNYLVATDELDDFLGYEPKCPNCGSKLLEIVYGMPDSETGEKAMNGELFLGGCMVGEENPKYHCKKFVCRTKKKIEYCYCTYRRK